MMLTDEQIREKLLGEGPFALSDTELLSIIIRDGGRNSSAIAVASALSENFGGNLQELGTATISQLRMSAGMGLQRAATVAAAMELAQRLRTEEASTVERIAGRDDVVGCFKPLLSKLRHEEFWALYLNSSGRILERVKISQGGISATVVDNKLIMKRAIEKLASSIIIVHNHPSGNPEPTEDDKTVTEKLRYAVELFDIELLDHVIVTGGECFSFRGAGLL